MQPGGRTKRCAEASCGHGGWPGLSLEQAGEAAWRRFHLSRDQRAGQEEGRGGASRPRQAQPASAEVHTRENRAPRASAGNQLSLTQARQSHASTRGARQQTPASRQGT